MNTTRRSWIGSAAIAGGGLAFAPAARPEEASPDAGILSVFAKRQTVRRYKSDPVPEEHVRLILDAARRGPTCMNQQPWKFLVIRDKAKIDAMRKKQFEMISSYMDSQLKDMASGEREKKKTEALKFSEGYFTAPVYVVVLVDTESPCSGYALNHDGPIAAGYLMLAARALGYGTAYLTDGISEAVTREVLNIPKRYHRICITPIGKPGFPDGWPKQAPKRKLEELIAWETLEGVAPNQAIPYNP